MSKRKTKRRSRQPAQNKPRNYVALAAFKRVGGAHEKSKSGIRREQKNTLKREVDRLAKQGDFSFCVSKNLLRGH